MKEEQVLYDEKMCYVHQKQSYVLKNWKGVNLKSMNYDWLEIWIWV